MLTISDLHVSIDDQAILKGFSLNVAPGTVHAIMGPNGSGKSTLAYTLAGHPAYLVTSGSIVLQDHDLLSLSPDKRSRQGIFLAFQHPYAIPGVTVFAFLKEAYQAVTGTTIEVKPFYDLMVNALARVGLEASVADRAVNDGFSGGEKKRLEIVQMLLLKPKLIVLDEIDSGLDIDALRLVAHAIQTYRDEDDSVSIICITHYQRILDYIIPDYVHIMQDGVIVNSGNAQLARVIEQSGYTGQHTDE